MLTRRARNATRAPPATAVRTRFKIRSSTTPFAALAPSDATAERAPGLVVMIIAEIDGFVRSANYQLCTERINESNESNE